MNWLDKVKNFFSSIPRFLGEVKAEMKKVSFPTRDEVVGTTIVVLVTSVVSFPLLLDRPVGVPVAVVTSVRVARESPGTVALWGLVVAGALVLGALPFLVGLAVVMPVLGHATWHLYRRAVG